MTVLVTGAPGWLGTRLVEVLRDTGKEVRALVLKGIDRSPLDELLVETFEGDVTEKSSRKLVFN